MKKVIKIFYDKLLPFLLIRYRLTSATARKTVFQYQLWSSSFAPDVDVGQQRPNELSVWRYCSTGTKTRPAFARSSTRRRRCRHGHGRNLALRAATRYRQAGRSEPAMYRGDVCGSAEAPPPSGHCGVSRRSGTTRIWVRRKRGVAVSFGVRFQIARPVSLRRAGT